MIAPALFGGAAAITMGMGIVALLFWLVWEGGI